MTRLSPLGMAMLGSGIIAITYGLARFVFGLFLPSIRDDLAMSAEMAGLIGSLPFLSFVAAIVVAPWVARRLGVRLTAAGATALAAAGLTAIAQAPTPIVLAAGVVVCGISTGLSSPAMARAVHVVVRPELRGRVNATINSGTSVGVLAAVPAVMLFADAWRPAYLGMAALAAIGLVAAVVFLPSETPPDADVMQRARARTVSRQQWREIARLSGLAGTMGFVSAVYWVFAPDYAVNEGGLPASQSALMWLAVGLGGLAGSGAGDLISKYGPAMSHAFALAAMSSALTLLASDPGELPLALVSAAAFGAAYMTLSGFYLVRSTQIMSDHPALGPVMPLLATSVGQVAGSPVAGWMITDQGHGATFGTFAALGLATAALSLWLAAGSDTSVVTATAENS